jgi:hypothetical protein
MLAQIIWFGSPERRGQLSYQEFRESAIDQLLADYLRIWSIKNGFSVPSWQMGITFLFYFQEMSLSKSFAWQK